MAELGHPVIGDGKYGGSGQENLGDGWGAQLGGEISRKLHLHARSLGLTHPVTKRRLKFWTKSKMKWFAKKSFLR
jgi:23S rRNA pseudouridine955/2504/2580 synthase